VDLLVLVAGPWKVVAELEERSGRRCSVLDDIMALGANYARVRAGLLAQIQMAAKEGPLGKPWIEPASSTDPRVYKFVKGDLRLYFLYAEGRMLLCSRCIVKKTRKTEKQHIQHALGVWQRYRQAVETNTLKEVSEHDHLDHVFQPR